MLCPITCTERFSVGADQIESPDYRSRVVSDATWVFCGHIFWTLWSMN